MNLSSANKILFTIPLTLCFDAKVTLILHERIRIDLIPYYSCYVFYDSRLVRYASFKTYLYHTILTMKTYRSVVLKIVRLFPVSSLFPYGLWLKCVSDFAHPFDMF